MVPCTRYFALHPFASCSNTRMKHSPIILRFFSGSVTPLSPLRKREDASTIFTSKPHFSKFAFAVSASPFLSIPVSTKTQWSFLPSAVFASTAAAVESTPPDVAIIASPSAYFFSSSVF